ncbi:histidine decarboxylase [Streptomyces sp. NPDC020983]|uniref:histidine decarboxylase n=1 Tax=Streptomyces sp. NPDC020983 TaxID=3365106 RepID=UPI0037BA6840
MAYEPPAGPPGAHAHAAGVRDGAEDGAPPPPCDRVGVTGEDPAATRRRLAALVAGLRATAGRAAAAGPDDPVADLPGSAESGDYAELLAAFADLDPDEPAVPGAGADEAAATALALERAVVDFCTDLALGDPRRVRGHVTGGAAEGLAGGLRAARHALPGAPLYVTAAAHHAARDHARRLGLDVVEVRQDEDGTMDTAALARLTAERPGGAIVLATTHTAGGSGGDDLAAVRAAAAPAGPVHVHVEAGPAGLAAPFAGRGPAWDLRDGADSLSFTAHRLLGLPVPCGVLLTAGPLPPVRGDGGRAPNPLATALLWAALRDRGYDGLRALVHTCYETACYAAGHITAAGYLAVPTGHGVTVRFPRPAAGLCARWRLTTSGPYACLTALPPVTPARVDALCRDLFAGGPLPTVPFPRPASEPRSAWAAR